MSKEPILFSTLFNQYKRLGFSMVKDDDKTFTFWKRINLVLIELEYKQVEPGSEYVVFSDIYIEDLNLRKKKDEQKT